MRPNPFQPLALTAAILTASLLGCELAVQLDRSAAAEAPDAGCAICSDAGGDDAYDAEATPDSPALEDQDAGPSSDARVDVPDADAGGAGGKERG